MADADPGERDPVVDLSELERIIRAEPRSSDADYLLGEIARNTSQTASHLAALVDTMERNRFLMIENQRAQRAELVLVRWLLLVLLLLAIQAMFIWGPRGWWHTPFWAHP